MFGRFGGGKLFTGTLPLGVDVDDDISGRFTGG
jgi:hypothetical protein